MTKPKPGDRVRGWVEGTVVDTWPPCVDVDNYRVPSRVLHDVEILPPPEPEWQPGDVVIDLFGEEYVRTHSGHLPWRRLADDRSFIEEYPRPPLRRARIVPEDGAS